MNKVSSAFLIIAFVFANGCSGPKSIEVSEKIVSSGVSLAGDTRRDVIERCVVETTKQLTPDGIQEHYPLSKKWSYWFDDDKTNKTEIAVLRRTRMGYGLDIKYVATSKSWIAVDVVSNGVAALILFDELGQKDRHDICFDYVDSRWSVEFAQGNQEISYLLNGDKKTLSVKTGKFVDGERK